MKKAFNFLLHIQLWKKQNLCRGNNEMVLAGKGMASNSA